MTRPRTVYYDHEREPSVQPAFPHGEAGPVVIDRHGEWTAEAEVRIGPNSHCALFHHGVAEALRALPDAEGSRAGGLALLFPPRSADAVARIFYEADRKTYGASYDFLVVAQEVPEPVHYRIAIDNREYQQTLSKLQFMSTTAARYGHGLRVQL